MGKSLKHIRLYSSLLDEKIKVCKHISLTGKIETEDTSPEYTEDLKIACHQCKAVYAFVVSIN